MAFDRLVTPGEHLGVLVEPDGAALPAMIRGAASRETAATPILDATVGALRGRLRQRLGLRPPVITTGHQPEFSHAGVFAKTIALEALVRAVGGTGVFLVVDSDVPKAGHLAVPWADAHEVRRELVSIPGCDPRRALEWQPRAPASAWRGFFEHVGRALGRSDTLLPAYVSGALAGAADTLDFVELVERGHAAASRALGLDPVPCLRVSQLACLPEFRALAAHILLDARRFAMAYNAAQQAYRVRRRERNALRPVPPLALETDRVELPLWASRGGEVRRRLFAAAQGGQVALYAGDELMGIEPVSHLASVVAQDAPWEVERAGWHIRPRALLLSGLARLLLGDLFIHGVGGAKYDEMTEEFTQRFFGTDLAPACCVSATLRLPLPWSGVGAELLAAARRAQRDLHFNPQRHLRGLPAELLRRRAELIAESGRLRRQCAADRAARRRVFEGIRETNAALRRSAPQEVAALESRWRELERRCASDRVALDREYFFALHPRRSMEELVRRVRAALGVSV